MSGRPPSPDPRPPPEEPNPFKRGWAHVRRIADVLRRFFAGLLEGLFDRWRR